MSDTPIQVGLLGMDADSISRTKLLFATYYKQQCAIANLDRAHIVLVETHAKTDQERQALKSKIRSYNKLPCILIGPPIQGFEPDAHLDYPPKLNPMWSHLITLTGNKGLESASLQRRRILKDLKSTPKDTCESANAEPANGEFFNLDDFFLGRLQSAIAESKQRHMIVHIKCWEERRIIYYPKSNVILSDLKASQLKNLGLVQIVDSTHIEMQDFTTDVMKNFADRPLSDVWAIPAEALLWNLAVRTARGRVPLGTSLDAFFQLTAWPNFTRLDRIPDDLAISASWMHAPRSLSSLVNSGLSTAASIRTFYTAAKVTGLLKAATEEPASISDSSLSGSPSLISSILSSLRTLRKSGSHA